jgi:hypothetical protein
MENDIENKLRASKIVLETLLKGEDPPIELVEVALNDLQLLIASHKKKSNDEKS